MVFEGGLGLPEDTVKETYGRDAGIAHAKVNEFALLLLLPLFLSVYTNTTNKYKLT